MHLKRWMIHDTSENRIVPAFGNPPNANTQKVSDARPPNPHSSKRNKAWRDMISARTEHTCFYCGTPEVPWTIEHLVPKSYGGTNDFPNLVRACAPCNHRRSSGLAIRHHMKMTPRFEQNLALAEKALKRLDEISLKKWGVPAHHVKTTVVYP
jgi:hypothetical protein